MKDTVSNTINETPMASDIKAIRSYCPHRLPCGLCAKTYMQCPFATNVEVQPTCKE